MISRYIFNYQGLIVGSALIFGSDREPLFRFIFTLLVCNLILVHSMYIESSGKCAVFRMREFNSQKEDITLPRHKASLKVLLKKYIYIDPYRSVLSSYQPRPVFLQERNYSVWAFFYLKTLRNRHSLDSRNSLFCYLLNLIALFLTPH